MFALGGRLLPEAASSITITCTVVKIAFSGRGDIESEMERRVDYRFMKINDAFKAINQRVNLIGVVLEFGLPRKCNGPDFYCNLKIVDQSYPEPGLSVNVFARTIDELPLVASAGDIILFMRITISSYEGRVNAVFMKHSSAFALLKGKDGGHYLPYQRSSQRFRMREEDKILIAELRQWLTDYKLMEEASYKQLKDITVVCNLACKVLRVCGAAEDTCLIHVWDGTDIPPSMILPELEDYVLDSLPAHLQTYPLPRHILQTFPSRGSILTMTIHKCSNKRFIHSLKVGQWIKFQNIECQVKQGQWFASFTPSTVVRYATEEDSLIKNNKGMFEERSSKPGKMRYWDSFQYSKITETEHRSAPFLTLRQVITYGEVTSKFRCIVRVVAALPWKVNDLLDTKGRYRVRLTLEDPTARIYAFVFDEDGDKFFGGKDPPSEALAMKWARLLGLQISHKMVEEWGQESLKNPPWIQCALKSYYLDKSKPWETRCFRIFDTWIID